MKRIAVDRQSRRAFLQASAMMLGYSAIARAAGRSIASSIATNFAFVGTYTGASGNGEGIYGFRVDARTGVLSDRRLLTKSPSPSWIVIHPSARFLYAVNETGEVHGANGSVSAFRIEGASGELTALNVVSSEGAGPCYASTDATGKYLFVANYGGGSIAVLPIRNDGSLGAATDVHRDEGQLGATRATNAPTGSFAISGHDAPHAHMVVPFPNSELVFATDLGQDKIYVYKFDSESGKVLPMSGAGSITVPSGDGPRHLAFHPNGKWLYSIQEEASNVVFFQFDSKAGSAEKKQTVSTLPKGFAGTSFASEILISPDGRFLYSANRLHDTVAAFSIGADGQLTWIAEASTMGDYPVQMKISPDGRFLYACNRRSDVITCFARDVKSGRLTFTGNYTAVGSPASIAFL